MGPKEYKAAFRRVILPILKEFDADILFISGELFLVHALRVIFVNCIYFQILMNMGAGGPNLTGGPESSG